MFLRSSNNKFPYSSRNFYWRIWARCRRTVFCNSVVWVSIPICFNQFLNFVGAVSRAPITCSRLSCSILFSSLLPNLGNVLFFWILWYRFFHHKSKQNLLSDKDFYPSVPQCYFYPSLPYISGSVCTVKLYSILHLLFSITTSNFCLYQFFSLLSRIFYIFPSESSFQTSHVIFYTPFGLTYCIPVSPRFTLSSAFQHILHLLFSWVTLFFAFVMLCVIWFVQF